LSLQSKQVPTLLTELPRKGWTRLELARLESTGVLNQQRFELIHGELISKMGKKRAHVNALVAVQAWLVRTFGEQYVNPEAPIDVAPEDDPTNEPEPDLVVLVRPSREYNDANPRPIDLRLVVEIADSTLGFDLTAKAELYARAMIVEYWVVDVVGRRIVVHRDPREGLYRSVVCYGDQDTVNPLAAPACQIRFRDLG
jgi:hypothetical protein